MTGQCKAFLLANAAGWNMPATKDWSFLLYNNYHPHCTTINLLWFHDAGEFPQVVTKLFHAPELPMREFENLKRVYNSAPDWIPRPLHFGFCDPFWMLWMEGVPGSQFSPHHNHAPAVLRSITHVIASLHRAVRGNAGGGEVNRHRLMVSAPLRTLAEFGSSAVVRSGCARVGEMASVEWLASLPVIPQHGDLFVSNVLSHRGKWRVIDWESFGAIDLPCYDLLTLMLSLLRDAGETPDLWKPALVKQMPGLVESYCKALDISGVDIGLLLSLTLANWFHLQWTDGRKKFADSMYRTIERYFEHQNSWEEVFSRRDEA